MSKGKVYRENRSKRKKDRRLKFKAYLREVASQRTESGTDTFQRILSNAMRIMESKSMSFRQYWMRHQKAEYRHYVRALRLNLTYSQVNKRGYGETSWLNCNNTNYIK